MVNSTTRNPKKDAQGNVISSWNNPPGTFKNDPAQTDAFNKILKQYIVGLPIPYGYGKLFQQMEAGKRAKLTVADM